MEGTRSTSGDGLWDIPITTSALKKVSPKTISTPSSSINIILRTDKKATDLAMYHHGAVFPQLQIPSSKLLKRISLLVGQV
jgi:hypothetical protein